MLTQEDLGQMRGLIREEVASAFTAFDFDRLRPVIREEVRQEVDDAISRDVSPVFQEIFRHFDDIDQRFDGIAQRFDGIEGRFEGVFGRLQRLEALMVTKDYLDDKLGDLRADLRGEMIERSQRSDDRFDRLLTVLNRQKVINQHEVNGSR